MFDSEKIREEISAALEGVRSSLAPGVLLRIHPNKVQDLAIADNAGDILILFPSERTIENDRTIGGVNLQTRQQKVLIVISLPTYYQEMGAGKISKRVEQALENLKVSNAMFPLTFESRREFFQQKRWVLEISFDIMGKQKLIEMFPIAPPILDTRVDIL